MSDLTASADIDSRLEGHRVELTGYCYRMLGSAFEAEDAVQDTLVRAWRNFEKFEVVPRCGPGCTASPPTSVWTC